MKRKNIINITESQLQKVIKESAKKFIKEINESCCEEIQEFADYEGNDLNFQGIYDQAFEKITKMINQGEKNIGGWRDIAQSMGLQLQTLNKEDYETAKEAIENAMMDTQEENDSNFLK